MRLQSSIREFVTYKQALGASYKGESNRLQAFLRAVGDMEVDALTRSHVASYLPIPGNRLVTAGWFKKYETLCRFFRFTSGRGYMQHQVLPEYLPEKPPTFVPYIYSDEDLQRLLGVPDSHYRPVCPLAPYTMRVFLITLYGTGLRLGETLKLTVQNVDLEEAIITVRNTKFYKSRLVPIGPDLLEILRHYKTQQFPQTFGDPDVPFFRTRLGNAVRPDNANHQFDWLRTEAAVLRFDNARYQPRLHDFRHTFAVKRLLSWYRGGKDVQRLLPHLSTYLGHVNIDETSKYLRMTSELLNEANVRFESYARVEGHHA